MYIKIIILLRVVITNLCIWEILWYHKYLD